MFFEQPRVTTLIRGLDSTDFIFDFTDSLVFIYWISLILFLISPIMMNFADFYFDYMDNRFTSQLVLPKLISKPVFILLAFKYDSN